MGCMSKNTESLVLPGDRDEIPVTFISTDKNSFHYKDSYTREACDE